MKYVKYGLLALVVIFVITAYSFEPRAHTETAFLLDTYISVTVFGGEKVAAKKAISRVEEIDKMFSAFREESEISKINSAAPNEEVKVSEECFLLIKRAKELSEKTDGAFDISIKPVMDLWDFGGTPRVPEKDKLKGALSLVDFKSILLNEEEKTVTLLKKGMALDLGGIAKGYSADCALEVLKKHGVKSACLDFGGNVVTLGEKPLGLFDRLRRGKKSEAFSVGIQDPTKPRGTVITTVSADAPNLSIVTSGGYERNFVQKGITYHHILDPKTGMQPEEKILSVTVVAPSSTTADALSTALFVLGEEGLSRVDGLYKEVIFVMKDGEVKRYN